MFRLNLSAVLRRGSSSVSVAVLNHAEFFQAIALTLVAAGVTWIVEAILPFCVYFAALHWMGLVLICQGCWAGIVFAATWSLHVGILVLSSVAYILSPLRPVWVDFRDGMIGTRIANVLVLPILRTATTAIISIADLLCATIYNLYALVTADRKQLADLSNAFFTQGYTYTLYSVFCCLALVVYGFIRWHRHSIIEVLDGTDACVVSKQVSVTVYGVMRYKKPLTCIMNRSLALRISVLKSASSTRSARRVCLFISRRPSCYILQRLQSITTYSARLLRLAYICPLRQLSWSSIDALSGEAVWLHHQSHGSC